MYDYHLKYLLEYLPDCLALTKEMWENEFHGPLGEYDERNLL